MRKIAIIAKTATAVFAPYDDPAWELWGMPWVIYRQELDLYFDIHSQDCWDGMTMPQHEREEWEARVIDAPILCHPSRVHKFSNARAFPYDAVSRVLPFQYLENTIAYQLAYALWSHKQAPISEVGLYGMNMMGKREYLWERSSVLYLVGLLQGQGITVSVPPGSALLMSLWVEGRYGESQDKRFQL